MKLEKAKNTFGVPRKQWQKWNTIGKHVFNKTYELASTSQELFTHPETVKKGGIPKEEWETIVWNHSWMAADIASRGLNHLLSEAKHYVRPKGD